MAARPVVLTTVPDAARNDALPRQALQFTTVVMALSLFLQRFGLPFGGASVSLVGPLGLAAFGYFLMRGTLVLDRRRVILYLALLALALLGLAWRATGLGWTGAEASTNSLLQFLLLSSVAVTCFARKVDEQAFFRTVNRLLLIVAIAGLLQFAAQFVGLRLFAFTGLLPDSMLFEQGYHLAIPVGVGELLKSNGFFLVEPSVFSQLMALALIMELLALRRPLHLAAFAAGLLLAFSGTGWIVIAAFVATAPLRIGRRGLVMAVGVVILLAALAALAAVLAPDAMAAFQQRIGEISTPGTSGHMRFVTPFWLLGDVLAGTPSAGLIGIGAGVSERLAANADRMLRTASNGPRVAAITAQAATDPIASSPASTNHSPASASPTAPSTMLPASR
jgi:hypothetical protein